VLGEQGLKSSQSQRSFQQRVGSLSHQKLDSEGDKVFYRMFCKWVGDSVGKKREGKGKVKGP